MADLLASVWNGPPNSTWAYHFLLHVRGTTWAPFNAEVIKVFLLICSPMRPYQCAHIS